MSREEKLTHARESFEWFEVYQEAGFTSEQAIRILCIPPPSGTVQYPPDFMEMVSKMNLLMDRTISE